MELLSARKENDLLQIIEKTHDQIHFIHLRNTQLLDIGSFYESDHLLGIQNRAKIMLVLLQEQKRRMKM